MSATNKSIKGISMFSGAGIAETYLKDVGIDILLANELDADRAAFYTHFYPKTTMVTGDISSPKVFKKYIAHAKEIAPKFLIATPPCQGMSSLGKKDYHADKRNFLIFAVIDAIRELDLDFILIENVPKFFKLVYPHKGGVYGIVKILEDLFSDKYIVQHDVLNAKDYGVPQSRPRAIIKLFKKGKKWGKPHKQAEISLRKAIGHLPSLRPGESSDYKFHRAAAHSQMQIEAMEHTPEGQSAMNNPVYFPKRKDGKKVKGFHNTYKRMKWDLPCPARTTNSGLISGHNNVHPGKITKAGIWSDPRVLTILELLIVSSLPENWNIPLGYKDSFVRLLIGEAVPPLMMKKIVAQINK